MSKPRGGLGRGLASLIPTGPTTTVVSDTFMNGSAGRAAVLAPVDLDRVNRGESTATATDGSRPIALHSVASLTESPTAAHADGLTAAPGGPRSRTSGPRYEEISTSQVRPNPRNPRSAFDEEALDELAHSIREFGLLQPVVVREVGSGYELVMGERRWRAAQLAGLSTIPAIVRRTEDAHLLRDALLENIHRANLNPLEEAAAYQQLLDEFDVTQEELAHRLGRSRPVISNTIRLLRLPVPVQRRVAAGILSAGHARALLSLELPQDQEDLAARVVAEGLSVRGTEEAVILMAGRTTRPKRTTTEKNVGPDRSALAAELSDAFDTRVRIEQGRQKGRLIIEFATGEDLERIVGSMLPSVRSGHADPVAGQR